MSKLNLAECQIFNNQRKSVSHNVNIYLEMFVFSFQFHFQNMLYFLCNPFFIHPITSNFFLLSKMIICFFIVVDKISFHCFSSQAVQILPTVLASSTSHYWCIISCMPYSFINCFWSNVNRLENWDIYEV